MEYDEDGSKDVFSEEYQQEASHESGKRHFCTRTGHFVKHKDIVPGSTSWCQQPEDSEVLNAVCKTCNGEDGSEDDSEDDEHPSDDSEDTDLSPVETIKLIKALKDKDSSVRAAAATGLANTTNAQQGHVIEPLAQALNDSELRVRRAAAIALGGFYGQPKRRAQLLSTALKDSSIAVVKASIKGLESCENYGFQSLLTLVAGKALIRESALISLATFWSEDKHRKILQSLALTGLQDTSTKIQIASANILENLHSHHFGPRSGYLDAVKALASVSAAAKSRDLASSLCSCLRGIRHSEGSESLKIINDALRDLIKRGLVDDSGFVSIYHGTSEPAPQPSSTDTGTSEPAPPQPSSTDTDEATFVDRIFNLIWRPTNEEKQSRQDS